jgi:hypothetical protein
VRIEVFYVPGCPNYQPAVERLRKILVSESCPANIREIAVNSDAEARAWQFPGSPTIRINGNDVEANDVGPGEAQAPSLACRLYANRSGVPSEETLRLALTSANRRSEEA